MCYSPRRILNPKVKSDNSDFDLYNDKVYLDVPCGHCGECQQRKMDAMYLRAISAYNDTVRNGGFSFFNTFTFNEENVPVWHGMKCFDSRLFRTFIVKLRVYLHRAGYEGTMKYLWVSEFGDTYGRPHHHCEFFLKYPGLTPQVFGELCEKAWIHGFTQTNNPYDLEYFHQYDSCVPDDRDATVKYVAKYVCKDFDFVEVLSKQRCSEMTDYLLHCYYEVDSQGSDITFDDWCTSHELPEYIDYSWLFKYIPRYDYMRWLPYNRISQGFGVTLIDDLNWDTLMDGYVMLPDKEKGMKKYMIPNYIDRKVFYDYNPDTKLYTLNDLGRDMKVHRQEHNNDYVLSLISSTLNNWHRGMPETKSFDILDKLDNICKAHKLDVYRTFGYDLSTVTHFNYLIEDLMQGRSLDDLYYYVRIYKDTLARKLRVPLSGDLVQDYCLLLWHEDDVHYRPRCDFLGCWDKLSNSDPAFVYFDIVIDIYQELLRLAGTEKQEKYILDKRKKSHFNNFKRKFYEKC